MHFKGRYVACLAAALMVAGCGNIAASVTGGSDSQDSKSAPDPASVISSTIADGAKSAPGSVVKISASPGWSIAVVPSGTGNVTGAVNASGAWVSSPLPPSSSYLFTATASDPSSGQTVARNFSGSTSGSKNTLTAEITPSGGKYGVGIIPRVVFSDPVRKSDRAQLEKRMVVTSSHPVAGDWYWESDQTAAYRPLKSGPKQTFWPGNSSIAINVDLVGAYAHGSGKDIAWGTRKYTRTIKTGRSMIIYVNAKTDQGYVTINGKKARSFGVSLGKPGFTSRSGIKTIMDTYRVKEMTNAGVTSEVYDLMVPYAMQITDTGEYFHGAPWNGNIGYSNSSHGCTNLEESDAAWFFSRVMYGDPLITTGTSRRMEYNNGQGAAWNVPEKKWIKG